MQDMRASIHERHDRFTQERLAPDSRCATQRCCGGRVWDASQHSAMRIARGRAAKGREKRVVCPRGEEEIFVGRSSKACFGRAWRSCPHAVSCISTTPSTTQQLTTLLKCCDSRHKVQTCLELVRSCRDPVGCCSEHLSSWALMSGIR